MIAVRDHLEQMGDALPVVVTFAHDPSQLAAYRKHLDVPFPVLADAQRALYHLLGVGRGSIRDVWSPGTIAMYVHLMREGRRLQRPAADTRQLGADAVIDRTGRLHRLWLPSGPDHRPPIADVIAAVVSVPNSSPD